MNIFYYSLIVWSETPKTSFLAIQLISGNILHGIWTMFNIIKLVLNKSANCCQSYVSFLFYMNLLIFLKVQSKQIIATLMAQC